MTKYELLDLLEGFPEDAEILLFHDDIKESAVIKDGTPFEIEHDADGTPCVIITIER